MRDLTDVVTIVAAAAVAIDDANAGDPTLVAVAGIAVPLALAQGRLAAEWVRRLQPDAEPAAVIAARAHHLRRWEVPRSTYPDGRGGYLRWRRDQKARHAGDVAELLRGVGGDDSLIARVQTLVERRDLRDVGAQLVEDAACLVFIELQLAEMAERIEAGKLVDVVRKTIAKMSASAIAAVSTIELPEVSSAVIARAVSGD